MPTDQPIDLDKCQAELDEAKEYLNHEDWTDDYGQRLITELRESRAAWHDKPTCAGLWIVKTTNTKFDMPPHSILKIKSDAAIESMEAVEAVNGVRVYGPIPEDTPDVAGDSTGVATPSKCKFCGAGRLRCDDDGTSSPEIVFDCDARLSQHGWSRGFSCFARTQPAVAGASTGDTTPDGKEADGGKV